MFDQLDSSTEFSGFSANSYLTPSSPNMTTGVTPKTFKSVSIIENCYSHTIRLDSKLIPEISKSIIDIHESNVDTKNGGNGEIHTFNIQNQKVCVTLYLNGTIHVQGSAHKLWVQTKLPVILESCKNKMEEIESPKNKSGFWKKIASAIKSPFLKKSPSLNPLLIYMDSDEKDSMRQYSIPQPSTPTTPEQKMKTPKKGTPMEHTRNYTDDPPPYPLYPGATSTPLTVEPQKLSFSENSTSLEETRIESLLLHSAIQSLVCTIDGLSPNKKVLLENAEICHTGYERPPDLNILTNMVKGLIQRLDKLDMDKTDEQPVNTPAPPSLCAPGNIADTQTDMIHSEPIDSEINKKLKSKTLSCRSQTAETVQMSGIGQSDPATDLYGGDGSTGTLPCPAAATASTSSAGEEISSETSLTTPPDCPSSQGAEAGRRNDRTHTTLLMGDSLIKHLKPNDHIVKCRTPNMDAATESLQKMRCMTSHFDRVIMVVGTNDLAKPEAVFKESAENMMETAIDCCNDKQNVIISAILPRYDEQYYKVGWANEILQELSSKCGIQFQPYPIELTTNESFHLYRHDNVHLNFRGSRLLADHLNLDVKIAPNLNRSYYAYDQQRHPSSHAGCYNCGERNHKKHNCWYGAPLHCDECGHLGHKRKMCPY